MKTIAWRAVWFLVFILVWPALGYLTMAHFVIDNVLMGQEEFLRFEVAKLRWLRDERAAVAWAVLTTMPRARRHHARRRR